MKKVLLIDESRSFRRFVTQKLERWNIEVSQASTGLDAVSKMRSIQPDLVIMDNNLSRLSGSDVLKQKMDSPNTANIPVILVSPKIGREEVVQAGAYGVKKFFFKPVKMDEFIFAIGEQLGVSITVDETPCVTEVHLNEGILFLEVALGLNVDKIDLMQFKISELLESHRIGIPRVLLMLSGFTPSSADSIKIRALLDTVIESTKAKAHNIVVLSQSVVLRELLKTDPKYSSIQAVDSLANAMKILQGKSRDGEAFVAHNSPDEIDDDIDMRFSNQRVVGATGGSNESDQRILNGVRLAIVDDDPVIQQLVKNTFEDAGCVVSLYNNGHEYISSGKATAQDLVFLDLMMPGMDGFKVLESLNATFSSEEIPPIIVFSAVSRRDAVIRALQNGIKSYLVKPLKPQQLRTKAVEVLQVDFC